MAQRNKSRRTKKGRLSVRGVGLITVKVFLVIAGFLVVLQASIGGVFRFERPQLTLAWVPYDAEARARLAAQLAAIPNSSEAQQSAINLATDAVRRAPVQPIALRALAVAQDGDSRASQDRALALIQQSQKLSRRDQLTQIWLIRHYIENGEFPQVIPHVDIALRSSRSAQQTLFPLLMSALEDERLFDPLLKRLREKPDWGIPFLAYLVANSPDFERTSRFSLALLDPREPKEREAIDALLQRLVAAGEYELAWNTYSSLGIGQEVGPAGELIDGGFDGVKATAPFGWVMANTPDLFASFAQDPRGSGSVLTMIVSSGHSGEVVRQLLRLPSGTYRLRAELGDVPEDSFERPELRVKCADGSRERTLASVKPASGGSAVQAIEQQFSIPAECRFQWFSVTIAGSDIADSDAPWIDNVELSRITG